MQIVQGLPVNPARPAFYDRTLASFALNYNAVGVAPHARTARSTRTTPAATIDLVASAYASLYDASAAGTPGKVIVEFSVTPAGAGTGQFLTAQVLTGGVAALLHFATTPGLYLPATSVITVFTSDGSTLGTIDYYLDYILNTFAA